MTIVDLSNLSSIMKLFDERYNKKEGIRKMKKLVACLLVLMMAFAAAGCAKKAEAPAAEKDIFAKSEGVMSYADYVAAEDGSDITIEAFVQAIAYNATYGNASLFLADKDGAYYVYRMPCTDADAAKLTPGVKIKVTGQKGSWSGELEVAEGTAKYELLEGNYIAPAVDVTDDMDADDVLIQKMNQLIAIKEAEVVASPIEGDDTEYVFWYGWENTAQPGENADLYFNVSVNGLTYNLCVESDECGMDTDVYKTVEGLKIGDKVNLEGFLYWYNGANPHITSVEKVG